MIEFNVNDYQYLPDNRVLKIKLKEQDDWLYVKRATHNVLQSFQVNFTPITKISLDIIKDLERFKQDKDDEENIYTIMEEPKNILEFELVEI